MRSIWWGIIRGERAVKSNLYSGSTIAVEAAKMPAYRLINTAPEEGEAMAKHIKEVTIHKDSSVTSVPGDVVDGDPYSCWELKTGIPAARMKYTRPYHYLGSALYHGYHCLYFRIKPENRLPGNKLPHQGLGRRGKRTCSDQRTPFSKGKLGSKRKDFIMNFWQMNHLRQIKSRSI